MTNFKTTFVQPTYASYNHLELQILTKNIFENEDLFFNDSSNLKELNARLLKKYGDISLTPKMTEDIQLKEIMREEKNTKQQ